VHVCIVVFVLFFQYLAKRLAVKNVSEMTYFVLLGRTWSLNSIKRLWLDCHEIFRTDRLWTRDELIKILEG